MTATPALAFPASKTLAAWWRQLAPLRPTALWVGHLLLHRVEARVALRQPNPIDPLALFVLRVMALMRHPSLEAVAQQLELERAFVRQVFSSLQTKKLVSQEPNGHWRILDPGTRAARDGVYTRSEVQRRIFYFVESEQAGRDPVFLPLQDHPALNDWPGSENWRFSKTVLEACLRQSAEWKSRHGFPLEVTDVRDGQSADEPGSGSLDVWRSVMLDQPKHLAVLLMRVRRQAGEEHLLGFAIQQDRWALQTERPAFEIKDAWRELLPEVSAQPTPALWQNAWREWCRVRGLADAEASECSLDRRDCILHVTPGGNLLNKLVVSHDDALKGEAWILCGAGRLRSAARIEIAGPSPKGVGHERRQ